MYHRQVPQTASFRRQSTAAGSLDPNSASGVSSPNGSRSPHPQGVVVASPTHDDTEVRQYRDLIATMNTERQQLQDELLVKNQVCISLGNSLNKTLSELKSAKSEIEARKEQIQNFTQELAAMRQTSQDAVNKSSAAEKKLQSLEHELVTSNDVIERLGHNTQSTESLHEEIHKLKAERDELNQTMADWKGKVKEALKESRRKEQQLMSTEITLRTELKTLQEELDKKAFQLQSAQLKENRQKAAMGVQTEDVMFTDDPRVAAAGGGASGRRGTHLRVPSSDQTGMRSPGVGAVSPAAEETPPPLPMMSYRAGAARSVSNARGVSEGRRSFPLPLPLSPQGMTPGGKGAETPGGRGTSTAAGGAGADGAPLDPSSPDPPEPPPIIVSIHFGTREGWTLDTKHAVTFRMTVDQLIHNCCDMIQGRYGQEVEAATMCLKMNHEKAKRSVTLSGHRELHSFTYLQKLQRNGEMVKLYLEVKDDLGERVREFMNPQDL